jgi:hypothetical protein
MAYKHLVLLLLLLLPLLLLLLQVPDLPDEDPDVRGGGQAYEDRHYRGDTEEQVSEGHQHTPAVRLVMMGSSVGARCLRVHAWLRVCLMPASVPTAILQRTLQPDIFCGVMAIRCQHLGAKATKCHQPTLLWSLPC